MEDSLVNQDFLDQRRTKSMDEIKPFEIINFDSEDSDSSENNSKTGGGIFGTINAVIPKYTNKIVNTAGTLSSSATALSNIGSPYYPQGPQQYGPPPQQYAPPPQYTQQYGPPPQYTQQYGSPPQKGLWSRLTGIFGMGEDMDVNGGCDMSYQWLVVGLLVLLILVFWYFSRSETVQTKYLEDALQAQYSTTENLFRNRHSRSDVRVYPPENLVTNNPSLLSSEVELPDASQFSTKLNLPYGMF